MELRRFGDGVKSRSREFSEVNLEGEWTSRPCQNSRGEWVKGDVSNGDDSLVKFIFCKNNISGLLSLDGM